MTARASNLLIGFGVALMIVGGAWWILDDGDPTASTPVEPTSDVSTASTSAASGSSASTSASTTSPTTPPTTTSPTTATSTTATPTTSIEPESPVEFFDRWAAAMASGDVEFLVARLHPAVLDRYVLADCRSYLEGRVAPDAAVEIIAVGATDTWAYALDGLTRDIPDALTVTIRRTEGGVTNEADSHVVVADDGTIRWFTDCGNPKEGAR